jgi:hypothetical protein
MWGVMMDHLRLSTDQVHQWLIAAQVAMLGPRLIAFRAAIVHPFSSESAEVPSETLKFIDLVPRSTRVGCALVQARSTNLADRPLRLHLAVAARAASTLFHGRRLPHSELHDVLTRHVHTEVKQRPPPEMEKTTRPTAALCFPAAVAEELGNLVLIGSTESTGIGS